MFLKIFTLISFKLKNKISSHQNFQISSGELFSKTKGKLAKCFLI